MLIYRSDHYFNWTMTYRADADILFTKGWMASQVALPGDKNVAPPQGRLVMVMVGVIVMVIKTA